MISFVLRGNTRTYPLRLPTGGSKTGQYSFLLWKEYWPIYLVCPQRAQLYFLPSLFFPNPYQLLLFIKLRG